MDLRVMADGLVSEALGRERRTDPAVGRSGGPAGNARLTAWTGALLLALFVAELVTLLDVRGLLSWHVAIGALLIPPALLKTASTGWRIVRYYTGNREYTAAGPPPMLLRLLGPLVVVSTLGVLGSGMAVILLSPDSARQSIAGLGIGVLTLHKGFFVIWGFATGLHVLARTVTAILIVRPAGGSARVAGRYRRILVLALTVAVAVPTAVLAVSLAAPWQADRGFDQESGRRTHQRR